MKNFIRFLLLLLTISSYGQTQHYVVTSINDNTSGLIPGELRWAIDQANNNPGLDYIDFNIALTPPVVIQLNADLPYVTDAIIIDGNTQPANGYTGNEPKIGIKGNTTSILSVLVLYKNLPGALPAGDASMSEVRNLKLSESSDATLLVARVNNVKIINNTINTSEAWGMRLSGASQCTVQGNILGTDNSFSLNSSLALKGGNLINDDNAFQGESNIIGGLNPGEPNYFYNTLQNTSMVAAPIIVSGNYNKISGNIFINNFRNITLNPGKGCIGNICHPVPVYQAVMSNNTANITGTATANDFIEIYKSNSAGIDAIQLLGTATANSAGQFALTISGLNVGENIIATATDPQNNTSEFGPSVELIPACVDEMPFHLDSICTGKPFCFAVNERICHSYHFSWDSGDGSPADTTCGWCHTYTTPGTYTISLTLSGSSCATSTVTSPVTVYNCAPSPCCGSFSITSMNDSVCAGQDFTFNINQSNCRDSLFVNFGDGTSAYYFQPFPTAISHAYTSPGVYSIIASMNNSNDSTTCIAAVDTLSVTSYNCTQTCPANSLIVNSGYDQPNGTAYSIGVADASWTVISDPDPLTTEPRPAFTINRNAAWSVPFPNSQWLSSYPTAANDRNGLYEFEYTFCLQDTKGISLDMKILADDTADVLLNGNRILSTQPPTSGYSPFNDVNPHSVTVTDPTKFVVGQNKIRVRVQNIFSVAMGFNADGILKGAVGAFEDQVCCNPNGSIQGIKWSDLNGDGVKSSTEPTLSGWTIKLTNTSTSTSVTTTTDVLGNYYFMNTPPGNYTISEVNQANWSQTFPSTGTYTINLQPGQAIINKDFGNQNKECSKCEKLAFGLPDKLCAKEVLTFTNLSANCSGATPNFMWNYGDGTPATTSNQHVYASPGNYVITLSIPATSACPEQQVKLEVSIKDCGAPCAKCEKLNFTFPELLCANQVITFTNQSSNCIGFPNYMWDYGDGTAATTSNQHIYANPGTYYVTLFIPASNGCPEQKVQIKIVVKECGVPCPKCLKLDFSFPVKLCANETITFTNLSSNCTGTPNYMWNYGDGTPSTTSNQHIYSNPGTYVVTLFIPGSNNCRGQKVQLSIVVKNCKPECGKCEKLSFSFPEQLCANQLITFTNTSSFCTGSPSFMWDYGDGTPATSSNQHAYSTPGSYTVTLFIPETKDCPGQKIQIKVDIKDCKIECPRCEKLNFSFPEVLCAKSKITFTNLSANCSGSPTFMWDYGDGTPVTSSNQHTYLSPGTYTVTLYILSSDGCKEQRISKRIDVKDCKVECPGCKDLQFTFPERICKGEKVTFINTTSGCTGSPTFVWNFGDGSPLSSNPDHIYTSAGSYTVQLIIPGGNNCPDKVISKNIEVKLCPEFDCDDVVPDPCIVCGNMSFSFPDQMCAGDSIVFNNTSFNCNGNQTFMWDYGDKTGATASNIHIFQKPGTYTVTLIIPGNDACPPQTVTNTVTVSDCCARCEKLQFSVPEKLCARETLTFTNLSANCTPAPVTFTWNYGDGTPVTSSNQHVYANPGTYTITLSLLSNKNCRIQQYQLTINVKDCNPPCPTCDKLDFSFALATTSTTTNTSISTEAASTTLQPAVAPVPAPVVSFCAGANIVFTNLSTNCTGNPTFLWNYGDGSAPTSSNTHIYSTPGTYTVTLYIPATNGCPEKKVQKTIVIKQCCPTCDKLDFSYALASTATTTSSSTSTVTNTSIEPAGTITLHPAPVTPTLPTVSFCAGATIVFTNLSTNCSGNPTFLWDYGDGSAPTSSNTHTYSTPGTYTVTLYIPATNGCPLKKVQKTIVIKQCCASCENLSFSVPAQICAQQSATFTMLNSNCTGSPVFMWKYGDGTAPTSSNTHTYSTPGTYTVTLYIPKAGNCPEQSVSKTVTVVNCNPCTLDATKTGPVTQGSKWVFTVSPFGGTGPYIYSWTVSSNLSIINGQGTNSLSTTIPAGGSAAPYTVTVVITDSKGCTVTKVFSYAGN